MMKSGSDWRNASRQFSRAHFSSLSHKLFKGSDASLQDVKTHSQKINQTEFVD
jgi:hypothetical protein